MIADRIAIGSMYGSLVLSSGVMPNADSGTSLEASCAYCWLLFLLFDSYFLLLVQVCVCKESHMKPLVSYAGSLILLIEESRIWSYS